MSSSEQQPADESKMQASEEQSVPSHEAIQKGLIYPPPPSYYQNMPVPPIASERPSLPPRQENRPPIAYAPSPSDQPYQNLAQRTMPPSQVPYPPGVSPYPSGQPGPFGQPPPAKKSYRWVWILVSVLGVILLAACGLCGWGVYSLFSSTYQQVSGSLNVVNDFYSNLQAENYSAAYSDLAPRGQIISLTQAQFTAQARKLDGQYGPVASFVLAQPSYTIDSNSGTNLTSFTITVNVKRTHLNYSALLTVNKINGSWKITEYDHL